jgi:hypothetical protein
MRTEVAIRHLGNAEAYGVILKNQGIEFSRLVASGKNQWEAQKACDTEFAVKIELAKAKLDISRAELKGDCPCR